MIGEPLPLPPLPHPHWVQVWTLSGVGAREPVRRTLEETLIGAAARHAGIPPGQVAVRRAATGRPVFSGLPPGYSCSFGYTHGLALAALAAGAAVGIDCEQREGKIDWRTVAADFFQAEEQAALDGAPDEASARGIFFQLWTRKEAQAKAAGLGVRAFGAHPTPGLAPRTEVRPGEWLLDLPLGSRFAGSVALKFGAFV